MRYYSAPEELCCTALVRIMDVLGGKLEPAALGTVKRKEMEALRKRCESTLGEDYCAVKKSECWWRLRRALVTAEMKKERGEGDYVVERVRK